MSVDFRGHPMFPQGFARTTSLERLKSGEPMWEWKGELPTMVGVLPRNGEAKDVRWYSCPVIHTFPSCTRSIRPTSL